MKKFSAILFAFIAFASAAGTQAAPGKRAVPACTIVPVKATTNVPANTVFDGLAKYGKWVCLVGSGSKMDGSQSESQIPHFILGSGSTLKNVVLGDPNMGTGKTLKAGGADGVHCTASCKIDNVYWGDVGEDAATMKGSGTMTVTGGAAYKGADKIFQNNGPGSTISISNFYAEEAGKLYRSCGNCSSQSARYVKVSGVTLYNVSGGVGVNSSFDSSKLPALKGAYDVATMTDFVSNKSSSRCVGYIGTSKGNEPSKDSNSSNIARSCKFQ
jgi:hypothetical protein